MNTFKFGKQPKKSDYRTLRFKSYATDALPQPAPQYNVLEKCFERVDISDPATLFPMDGNDKWGCCTIAALCHAITVFHCLTLDAYILSEDDVLDDYWLLTGGEDTGLNELDVLNYWHTSYADKNDAILAYVAIDPHNHTHIMQAISLFGGVYLGFQCQAAVLDDFNARRPWTPGPLLNEGHAVYAVGYDTEGVTVLTWGNVQRGTWAWWDETVDEVYALLPPQAAKPTFAPGFDIAKLTADLMALAG